MSTLRAYFGHHKCGTTWISRILEDVCALAGISSVHHHDETLFAGDIVALREANPFGFWRYTNADINFARHVDLLGFHVVRDPRDLIVSAYFSHMYSHSDEYWPRLRHFRKHLRTLSKEDGLIAEMEFCGTFLHHMLSWDYRQPNVLELHFEDLIANQLVNFERICDFLALDRQILTAQVLNDILATNSFRQLSGGRNPGQEDERSHYRNGIPGDWRNHFTSQNTTYFKSLYDPLLLKLGYEQPHSSRPAKREAFVG